jgi:hypothetical protein
LRGLTAVAGEGSSCCGGGEQLLRGRGAAVAGEGSSCCGGGEQLLRGGVEQLLLLLQKSSFTISTKL